MKSIKSFLEIINFHKMLYEEIGSSGCDEKIKNYYRNILRFPQNYWFYAFNWARRIEQPTKIVRNEMNLLDAGCGLGTEAIYFANLGIKVLGIDLNQEFVEKAQKRKKYYENKFNKLLNIDFKAANIFNLNEENYFDKEVEGAEIIKFKTGKNKLITLLHLINPLNTLKIIGKIRKIRPSTAHLFFGEGYPMAIFLSLYLKLKRIPLIITLHDPEIHPGNFIEKLNGILRRATLKLADGIHIHSRVFIGKVKKLNIENNKIFIIPHGSFAPLFRKYVKKNVPKEDTILFFGRLEKYKGLEYLIEAGLRLRGEFKVVIADPGNLDEKLHEVIKNNPNIFEFRNRYISREEATNLFQKSKVCVLPYIQATQSALPLISAFFGVPVVATNIGAFAEDIPRINGTLVNPKDVNALIDGIRKALEIKPRYSETLEFSNLVNDYFEVYKNIKIKNIKCK